MAFWVFMLICDLLTPVMMVLLGRLIWKHPPKDINALLGYRTNRSMKNQDTWRFAHVHCGKLWYKLGLLEIIASALPFVFLLHSEQEAVSVVGIIILAVQMIILLGSIFPTEAALKRTFDEEGKRRRKNRWTFVHRFVL